MLREFANSVYIGMVFVLFRLLRLLPLQKKVVFLCDFGDNTYFTADELLRRSKDIKVVLIKTKRCRVSFDELLSHGNNISIYSMTGLWGNCLALFHIGTASKVVTDNYFPFFSVYPKRIGTEVIQLWHAGGAVKKFALKDPSFSGRYSTAKKRIRSVYHNFDKVVVGSDKMSSIFAQAFDVPTERMLPVGIPRTDFFFDSQQMLGASQAVREHYPSVIGKKVILYAPTFREQELGGQSLPIDFPTIMDALGSDYVLLIRMHPAVKIQSGLFHHDRIVDVSSYPEVNHLLTITDILITDYSSLPYEFALLGRPQIFYPYDLEAYEKERGFWMPYEDAVPGPVVRSDSELIAVIQNEHFDVERVHLFSNKWNAYNTGNSSKQLVSYLLR